jgi:hyaluronoglucosaminidase
VTDAAEGRDAPFRHRGIVEGFYGPPFAHADRLWWIGRLGAWDMNRYVYAPKDDPLHRDRWREPYPAEARREFAELVEAGARAGVEVGFAISPGLSIQYSSADDCRALLEKLATFRAMGSRFLCLAVDDVPFELAHAADRQAFASLAHAHVALAHAVREEIGDECTLWLVPTDYLGVGSSDYLADLGAGLAPDVEVAWTGRTVLSPTIEAGEIRARAAALGRPLLLWDNTPAADGPMRRMLHLNPYLGRDPELASHASGVLLNPMQHARASGVTVFTAARFLADPAGYAPEAAFDEAVAELGLGAPEAFSLFAQAHRFSPLTPDDRDRELEQACAELRRADEDDRDPLAALAALRAVVAEREGVAERLRSDLLDRRLADELSPWIDAHARETRCMAAALDCAAAVLSQPVAKDRVFALFALASRLSREPVPPETSYGPRRVLYPQLSELRDDTMALSRSDPTLVQGRCLADEVISLAERLALARLRES